MAWTSKWQLDPHAKLEVSWPIGELSLHPAPTSAHTHRVSPAPTPGLNGCDQAELRDMIATPLLPLMGAAFQMHQGFCSLGLGGISSPPTALWLRLTSPSACDLCFCGHSSVTEGSSAVTDLCGAGGGLWSFPKHADISVLGYRRCQLACPIRLEK